MDERITIEGQDFERVAIQRGGSSAVYRGSGVYLRLGTRERLEHLRKAHREFEHGFPVPPIIKEGEFQGMFYFIEESIGEKKLGELFKEDWAKRGTVSDEHFEQFIATTETYTKAQLTDGVRPDAENTLAHGVHLEIVSEELPEHAARIRERFAKALERMVVMPLVITHGDYNPQNVFAKGVIDLEDVFVAPAGYDQISGITTIDFFPDGDYEYVARYRFSELQKQRYLDRIDSVFVSLGSPSVSGIFEDLSFLRALWTAARMHKWPKIQKWRYDLLVSKYLS